MVREGVWDMGASDAVMNGNEKLGSESKPKGAGGSGVVGLAETVREEFFSASKCLENDGGLGGFGKVKKLEGVGDGDGVRIGSVFDGGEHHFTIRNGDGFFGDGWDVGIHGK